LARAGLEQRTADEGPPLAVGYPLTDSGSALLLALRELTSWDANHLPSADWPVPAGQ